MASRARPVSGPETGLAAIWLKALVFLTMLAFFVYRISNADRTFSYDYEVYIYYIKAASLYHVRDLLDSLLDYLPLPYILLPPNALFEFGFVFSVYGLSVIGFSPAATYTIVAGSSIALRIVQLFQFRTSFFTSLIVLSASAVLYEANALRLGVCSSLLMAALYCFLKNRNKYSILFALLSITFHVQAVIYGTAFLVGFFLHRITRGNSVVRLVLFGGALIVMAYLSGTINLSSGVKIQDYVGRGEVATAGFNVLSVTCLISVLIGFGPLLRMPRLLSESRLTQLWMGSYFALWQSLLLLIFGDQFADIGIRLWQFAFIAFVIINEYVRAITKENEIAVPFLRLVSATNLVCLVLLCLNIVIRYPLSNLFEPVVPFYILNPSPIV